MYYFCRRFDGGAERLRLYPMNLERDDRLGNSIQYLVLCTISIKEVCYV